MPAPSPHPKKSLKWWSLTVVWAGLIFYLSTRTFGSPFSIWLLARILSLLHTHVSSDVFNLLQYLMRRSAHLTVYAILAIFIYYSLAGEKRPPWSFRRAAVSVILAGFYSLTDEFHQSFVPGRDASLWDCGVDTIGAILGSTIIYMSGWLMVRFHANTAARLGKPE